MFSARSLFRSFALGLILVTAARLGAQVNLQYEWSPSTFPNSKIPSGQSYSPTFVIHGGTFVSGPGGTVMSASVTKSGGTGYTSSASTSPGTAQGLSVGTTSTTDTGNIYVSFSATGHNSTSGETVNSSAVIKIYVPDSTAPSAPSNLTTNNITTSQFTLSWNTSTDNQVIEFYTVYANGVAVGTVNAGSFPPTYSFTYTGLSPGTTYPMKVRATDWAGNYTESSVLNVTTAVPDTTPPSQPGNPLFSDLGAYGVTVSWAQSTDNVGVTGYTVQLLAGGVGGSVVSTQTTASSSVSFASLTSGTTYGISIVAKDAANNSSTASTGTFTTVVATAPGPLKVAVVKDKSLWVSWDPYAVSPATDHYDVEFDGVVSAAGGSGTGAYLSFQATGLTPASTHTIRVRAVSTTSVAGNWSVPLTVTTDDSLASLGSVTRPTGTGNLVATAGGALSVDNHGSANYSIPLQISPGRSGLQPSVSLNYSSGAGNGVAGVGFSVSTGFSQSITRGRSILARDGETRGIEFSSKDKFYLDGKRLICTSEPTTPYGMPGSTYRTEVDSFVTVTTAGTGSNIETFYVTDKSGTKSTYGKLSGATDGYQHGSAELSGLAYTYALKRVEDALGNYVAFTYLALGGGEYVLDHIDYTGGTSISPAARVSFQYESRTDQPTTFIANRGFNHRARLAVITATSGAVTTSAYGLNYATGTTGRSRLTSIAPVLADPQTNALQACPSLTIGWQDVTSTSPGTPPTLASLDVTWGDTNLDGADEPLVASDRQTNGFSSYVKKFGDFDGDGKKDYIQMSGSSGVAIRPGYLTVTLASGGSMSLTPAQATVVNAYFTDPGSQYGSTNLAQAEGLGLAARVTIGDFNGDGRDDLLFHGFDGKIHVYLSNGTGFSDPVNDTNAPYLGGAGDVSIWTNPAFTQVTTHIDDHFWVKPMPCDLNGDGITDYVAICYSRMLKYPSGPYQTGPSGFRNFRTMIGVITKPDGTFSAPFAIGGPAMVVPLETNDTFNGSGAGTIKLDDLNTGALPGDFNGDGLTDFLVLVPQFEMQPGLFSGYYQSKRWALYLNQGLNANGTPTFAEYKGPIPNSVTLGSGSVNTYYTPCSSATGSIGGVQYLTSQSPDDKDFMEGFQGASGSINNLIMDVNHDGLADLVWYVPSTQSTSPGWYAMLSTGNFADGSGFSGPVAVGFLSGTAGGTPASAGSQIITTTVASGFDYNRDGYADYMVQSTINGHASAPAVVSTLDTKAPQFCDLVTTITDGLGRVTSVAYKAAKDSTVYTPGATVSYPIKEMFGSNPVVSDVWQDSGGATPAQFSYQYSGNRMDFSGRGSLGFHSFVTLDRQTNFFTYQFLAQSFPMTGLTHREETYRWLGGTGFNVISSHDNKVVFDLVKDVTTNVAFGTLWPFISSATESRWEDGAGPISTGGSNLSSDPENVFTKPKPVGAHIVITAQSKFDYNTSVITSPPAAFSAAGYNTSDTTAGGLNNVKGTGNINGLMPTTGSITFGNLTSLSTDYGSGYTETVTTTYKTPQTVNGVVTLTGLVSTVDTSTTGGGYNDAAPQKSYQYFGATPLVLSETITGGGALTTTTTYNRDAWGRVTSTQIAGTDLQYVGQGSVNYTTSSVPDPANDFDNRFDLPKRTQDAYGHITTTVYHAFLGKPTSVTDVNGAQVTTTYDALGRPLVVTDVLKNLTTTNSYDWDATQPVSGPPGFNGASFSTPTGGVAISGVTVTSAYKVTTSAMVKPTVTAYYDRLGRVIRTNKDGFNGTTAQQIVTDNAYNSLGQQIATSLPYISGATPLWTKTTYDPVGRVATVTTPNGTITSNTYIGLATQVSTDAPNLGGVDPAAQVNTTLVDAKGRTVKVWNANNVPSFSDNRGTTGTAPSIVFTLDGFGRMRVTSLKDQTQTITANYDLLGHQTQLADPDKGTWNYTNSALGHVLTQTDGNGNTTDSSFDQLGRPLHRYTHGTAPAETADFYYYDTSTVTSSSQHTVAKGAQGWIGAPEREECTAADSYPTTNLHYYDDKGRPAIELAQSDGKWFYTYSDYDLYSRVRQVRHFWKPKDAETPTTQPYLWQDFGYFYTYDGSGTASKSYLIGLTDSLGRSWWDTPVYDHMDRVTSVRKGSGLTTTRTYRDTDGVLTAINTGSGSIQNMGFNFDGLGNLTSRSDIGVSEGYGYDNLNRLKTRNGGTIANYQDNGNINSKTEVGGSTVTIDNYDATRPHAVWKYTFNGQQTTITYNGNGDLLTRSGGGTTWSMNWTGFDKPRWMAKTTGSTVAGSEFHYNAARSRVMQLEFDSMSAGAPLHYARKRTYALGSTLELNYNNAINTGSGQSWTLDTVRIYVPGPDGIIGAREFRPAELVGGVPTPREKTLVYHYDHLGSITAITNFGSNTIAVTGSNQAGRYSEDAWGQRRNPTSWSGAPVASATDDGGSDSLTPRGFTGHEMLDDLGLVHMNGRIYDPLLGRFLSADVAVQFPGSLQNYNRYSYLANNPLSGTDPSGFVIEVVGTDEEKKRLQQKMDEQMKKDPKFAAQYKALADSKNTGLRIGYAPKETASIKATASAGTADTSSKSGPATTPTTGSDGGAVSQKVEYTPISRVTQISFTEGVVDKSGTATGADGHPAETTVGIDHPNVGASGDGGVLVGFNLHQKVSVKPEFRGDSIKLNKALAREDEHVQDNATLFNGAFKSNVTKTLQNAFFSSKELADTVKALDTRFQSKAADAAAWWDSARPSGQNFHDVNEDLDSYKDPTAEEIDNHRKGLK